MKTHMRKKKEENEGTTLGCPYGRFNGPPNNEEGYCTGTRLRYNVIKVVPHKGGWNRGKKRNGVDTGPSAS